MKIGRDRLLEKQKRRLRIFRNRRRKCKHQGTA